ncbi:hypothetical protein UFOVP407_7 [uncultured Caudovirales phage]|uniref:Uncharacterized protein n=1 Tax=uncultured Caudovirales phage TaxID=2100421 RepID=A0A6J5LZM1_9CAUD|nr:hypothetical protein UFOVP407_7 [uncultured Caudovirales phage]
MSDWQTAMLCILPLMLASGIGEASVRAWWYVTGPKLRCWAVILAASLAARSVTPAVGETPFQAYMYIDFLAGVAIAARPFTGPQRILCLLFISMVVADFLGGAGFENLFRSASLILGYAMWAVLLIWGMRDAGRGLAAILFGCGRNDHPVASGMANARRTGEEP